MLEQDIDLARDARSDRDEGIEERRRFVRGQYRAVSEGQDDDGNCGLDESRHAHTVLSQPGVQLAKFISLDLPLVSLAIEA